MTLEARWTGLAGIYLYNIVLSVDMTVLSMVFMLETILERSALVCLIAIIVTDDMVH